MSALASRRKTLRLAVAALIEDHVPSLVGRVRVNQYAAIDPNDLPLVCITTPSAQREFDNADEMDIRLDLAVNIFAGETPENPTDDQLDHFSEAIEAVLLAEAQTLGGAVYDIRPGPQLTTTDESGENIYGVAVDMYTLHTFFTKPQALNEEE
jgi:hypothetical protein